MLDHSNVFLPRVNSCPRVVMISAVGRGLKSLYAVGPPEKSAGAMELGRRGSRKRADSVSAERRAAIARKAAEKLRRLRLPPYR